MKKMYCLFSFFLFFNSMAKAQMDALFNQTRTAFIENIENPGGAVSEVLTSNDDPLVELIRTTAPNIGAFDEDQTDNILDYDYQDGDVEDGCISGSPPGGWEPESHLEHLARMAEGYARILIEQPNNTAGANDIADALILGLQYWYSLNEPNSPNFLSPVDCQETSACDNMFPENAIAPSMPWCCDNWFKNFISKPRLLSKIGILFYDRLTGPNAPTVPDSGVPGNGIPATSLLDAIIADLPVDALKYNNGVTLTGEKYTGANLTDIAGFVLMNGILSHDYVGGNNLENPLVDLAITEFEEGALTPGSQVDCNKYDDGIQADNSFFQHRRVLYSSGYGYSFIRSLSLWGSALSGNTEFFFEDDHQDFLLSAVLDGWRWMVRGNTADYSVSGRYITRLIQNNYNTAIPNQHMVWLVELAEGVGYDCLPQSHPNYVAPVTEVGLALEDMKIRAQNNERQNILGNKFFWKADYLAHHEAAFFSSVKMCAKETIVVNECDGTTDDDVNARTSGTESRSNDNRKGYWLPYGCTFIYQSGDEYDDLFSSSDFDWNRIPGVTSAELSNSDLKPGGGGAEENTHESNFVGSAGNGSYSVTTLELDKIHEDGHLSARKAWFHFGDEIIALGSGISDDSGNDVFTTMNQSHLNGPITPVSTPVSGNLWLHHDQTAYIYFDPSTNSDYTSGIESDDADDIFTAWIEHQDGPVDATYFYRIVPGIMAAEVVSYIQGNQVELLENGEFNGSYRQAVKKGDLTGIIHYPPTDVNASFFSYGINVGDQNNPVEIETSEPCALLYDASTKQVCISSPDRSVNDVILTITINGATHQTLLVLPHGEFAGTSTCVNLFAIGDDSTVRTHCGDTDEDMDGLLDGNGAGSGDVDIYDNEDLQVANLLATTNSSGNYGIYNLNFGTDYVLKPSKDIDYYNGISSFDLVIMTQHILQSIPLTSPHSLIAADVNRSGSVSTIDIGELKKLILHIDEELSLVDSYEFVDASHLFPNPSNPFERPVPDTYLGNTWPFPQIIEIDNLEIVNGEKNFTSIKMGDVNCSGTETSLIGEGPEVTIVVVDKTVTKDEIVEVDFKVENFAEIEAYQLGIEFDSEVLEKQAIETGDLNGAAETENFGLTDIEDGEIRSVWLYNDASDPNYTVLDTTLVDSSSLFTVEFKALQDYTRSSSSDSYKLSDLLRLNDDVLANRAYSKKGVHNIKMVFVPEESTDEFSENSSLLSPIKCFPNPAKEEVNFQLNLRNETEVQLQIFDPLGQLVTQREMTLPAGQQNIDMNNIGNWENGLYYYVVRVGNDIEAGKFVKL